MSLRRLLLLVVIQMHGINLKGRNKPRDQLLTKCASIDNVIVICSFGFQIRGVNKKKNTYMKD